jgi:hypothetical protein
MDVAKAPIMNFFADMARAAKWDILRINRLAYVDIDSEDDNQLRFIAEQVDKARRDGYRRIVLGGHLRGAWLALSGAAIEGVDGVIGLTPATRDHSTQALEWQRDELSRRLTMAKARRVAVFFFRNDPNENIPGGRADSTRRALERAGSEAMIVDQPPNLEGYEAPWHGRFVRRYRECVMHFIRGETVNGRRTECPTDSGYAVGADIGFPAPRAPPDEGLAKGARFAAYSGRWQGDSDGGDYVILEPIKVSADELVVRLGLSPPPGQPRLRPWLRELSFRADEAARELSSRFPGTTDRVIARLKSATEIDLEIPDGPGKSQTFVLRRLAEPR